jgi:hypothetical protein
MWLYTINNFKNSITTFFGQPAGIFVIFNFSKKYTKKAINMRGGQ